MQKDQFLGKLMEGKADISIPLTHRLVLRALEAGECLSAFKHVQGTLSVLLSYFVVKKILRC